MKKYLFMSLGFVLLFAFSAFAQNNCLVVRGIAQEHLLDFGNPDWEGGRPGDPWVGPVQLILGNDEVLTGKLSENDGGPGPRNGIGQSRGGSYFFDFGVENGTFIGKYDNAIWPNLPKFARVAGTGTFHAQGKVSNGGGRFANATGNITTDGPFLAWNIDQPIPSARFNNTISGMLCGVAAK